MKKNDMINEVKKSNRLFGMRLDGDIIVYLDNKKFSNFRCYFAKWLEETLEDDKEYALAKGATALSYSAYNTLYMFTIKEA